MSELEIFAAALQITDAVQRAEYLDRVCGADRALRRRIEVLLRKHEEAGSFLQSPAGPQFADALFAAGDPQGLDAATQAGPGDDERDEDILHFLQPSTKPGALGRLGHYEVMEVLGHGGFGTVVRAFDEKLHRMVAIKVMSPRLAVTSPARKRFVREARSSAAIRHENVVDIHAIEEKPIPFLVMEYVAGETLQQKLDRTGPLDPTVVLRIGMQIAQGLAAAHAMGKIHRDIKPANILLENGVDRVKITDFGLARAADDASLTQSGYIAGTPSYMAPEQAQGLTLDHRADLFSLGSVLYVMCSGRPPFRAATTLAVLKRVIDDTPRPIREIIPEVPRWLCDLIAKLHAKKPDERFGSAREVADVLGRFLQEATDSRQRAAGSGQQAEKVESVKETTLMRRPAVRHKRRWILAAAAIVLLPLIGLALSEMTNVTNLSETMVRWFLPERNPQVVRNGHEVPPPGVEDPDRRGAKWVLSIGGTVCVNGEQRALSTAAELPAVFRLTNASLQNKQLSDEGLANLKECKSLEQLELTNTNVSDAWLIHFKGFMKITGLGLSGTSVGDDGLANFKDCKGLARLDLRGSKVTDAGLAFFKDCENLGLLDAADTSLGDTWMAHLTSSKGLATLVLNQTKITDAGLPRLKQFKRLRILELANTQVSDTGLAELENFPKLATLIVKNTQVSESGVKKLATALPNCRIVYDGGVIEPKLNADRRAALWVLKIGGTVRVNDLNTDITTADALPKDGFRLSYVSLVNKQQLSDEGLANFRDCKDVKHLDLNYTNVADAWLVHFQDCRDLQYLDLSGTTVGDGAVAQIKDYSKLMTLRLHGTNVTDIGLAYFKDAKKLVHLNLGGTKFTDAGLACFKDCSNLGLLDLSQTAVQDAWLVHFKDCKHLGALELYQTQVGDTGLAYFKDCKKLSHLELSNTQVSDKALVQMRGYPLLFLVNLKNTKTTEAALKKLSADMPKCNIHWDGGVLGPG